MSPSMLMLTLLTASSWCWCACLQEESVRRLRNRQEHRLECVVVVLVRVPAAVREWVRNKPVVCTT